MINNDFKTNLLNYFDILFPNPKCFLNYSKDYELLIAVMLSAQTTDKKVNTVTAILYKKYDTLKKLSSADLFDIETIIKPLGMYKIKGKNVIGLANKLLLDFHSIVPSEKEELLELPGVGIKTANVVRAELFNIPEFPVDTHINRISKRLGISVESSDVTQVEKDLKRFFDEKDWIRLHHQFIMFGRSICNAKKPACSKCNLRTYCSYFSNLSTQSK